MDHLPDFVTKLWQCIPLQTQNLMTQVVRNKYFVAFTAITGVLTIRKILDIVRRKWYNLPPGPVGLPFLGTALDFGDPLKMISTREQYGPIFLTHVGFSQVCFINDYKILEKYFSKREFLDRKMPDMGVEYGFSEAQFKHDWKDRRHLMTEFLSQSIKNTRVSQLMDKTLTNHIFPIVDACCQTKIKWNIRKECFYITFATIYGMYSMCFRAV